MEGNKHTHTDNAIIHIVKVKIFIDTGSSANILCYETLNKISKLNIYKYKLKKTSIKLILFGSSSQNSFTCVKDALSVLVETLEYFANAMFYVIKNNATNIISGDMVIQLGLLTLRNKVTYTVNSPSYFYK